MKHYQIKIFFFSLLVLSCTSRKADNSSGQRIDKNTVTKTENPSKLNNESIKSSIGIDFIEFWQIFRNAVIDSDTNKIIQLTNFPFETRGPLDSDPIIYYDKKLFLKVFNAYLDQTANWREDSSFISSREEIKRMSDPDKTYIQSDWARVGNLEFKRMNGMWHLTFAYLEYPTIEKLNK